MDRNAISVIDKASFPRTLLRNLSELDLSFNPFDCSCNLFWFLEWIKEEEKMSSWGVQGHYVCSSPASKRGTGLEKLVLTPEECLGRPLAPAVWASFAVWSFVLCVALTSSALHRFRWRLRIRLFHLSNWLRPTPPRRASNHDNFVFDLFVSHNSSDAGWVAKQLVPHLENKCQPPFRLCVCSRNWLAGGTIADCVVESLAVSRKTLFVVTNAFAKSEWCQFELTMAQHHLIETDNDNLVLAVMEDIDEVNMNPRLRLLLKRKVYLQWTEDPVGQEFFWKKLEQTLRAAGGSLVEATPSNDEINALLATRSYKSYT